MTSRKQSLDACVEVNGPQLREGFRMLRQHANPKRTTVTVLSRDGEDLVVQTGGVEIRAEVKGRWEGEARVKGLMLFEAVRDFPQNDYAEIRVEGGRLVFSSLSVPCDWERNSAPRVLVPINASLLDVLRIDAETADEDLERNGVLDAVLDARKKRKRLIRSAVRTLEQFKIPEEAIAALVDERIHAK